MKTSIAVGLILALTAFAPTAGYAQSAYKSDDIVKFFEDKKSGNKPLTRGLCIGTAEKCGGDDTASATDAAPAAEAFDLIVTFDLNSSDLTAAARRNLDEFATALKNPRLNDVKFEVAGHTDASGSDSHNKNLSQRRADAVVDYLAQRGADASRLIAKGYGENQPRVDNPLDPQNRRVETRLVTQ